MRMQKSTIQCPKCRVILSIDAISAKLFDNDVEKYMKDENHLMR
jgi:hypothetical protein